ncbi:g3152 [Coccomyxa elongata]
MKRRDKLSSLEEKCLRLEGELQMSNQTILSLLEQGADAKEIVLAGGDKNPGQAAPQEQTMIRPGSKQLPLQPNPLWEPQGQLGKLQAAKIPAKAATSAQSQDQYNMSAGSIKSYPGSGQTSSTVAARSAGHCEPYSSEREQDLISLSPPSREATSAGNAAFLGGPADAWHGQEPSLGLTGPALGGDEARLGLGGTQGDRIRDARRKAAAAEQGQKRMEPLHRPAWNAGPAARPPPRGRKPTQILRQSTQSLPASSQGKRESPDPCILAPQPEARNQGALTSRSLPGNPVARLAAQRAGNRRATAAAPSYNVGNPVDRLQQLGQQAQLMTEPLEAAAQLDEAAAQREAHTQARLKNKLIAELRDHKRQLAEELEAAVAENRALREVAVKGSRAKEQVDALLEALKHEKDAHAAADQEAAAARQDSARLQQRVKALIGKQAMDRDHIRKLEGRVAEKARMLEQLYATTKDLKSQFEASQQDATQAAAHASDAVQRLCAELAQHQRVLSEAQAAMQAATAAATRAEERFDELARDLRTEQEARKAAEAALEAMQADDTPNQGSPPIRTVSEAIKEADLAYNARRLSNGGIDGGDLQAELSAAHRRADELQLQLDDSVAEARRHRQRAKWLAAEVAAFRGRIAGHVDEDVLQEVPETPDSGSARPRCFSEARSHLLDTQEALRRQLQAHEMKAAESRRAHALAVEVATLKQQMVMLQSEKSSCSESFRTVSRTTSDAASHQEPHVSSVKEAFEAMSASGGWAVYDNRAARRVSVGGSSASA